MASLTAAHRGYEYQDLLVACRLVDMLLGTVVQAHMDEKFCVNDRFNDLTTVDVDGRRERTQFKYSEAAGHPLSLNTFTTDARGLRLDSVIASILADRSGLGGDATSVAYRILSSDGPPIDPNLTRVLQPLQKGDPGPFLSGIGTSRFRFAAAEPGGRATSKNLAAETATSVFLPVPDRSLFMIWNGPVSTSSSKSAHLVPVQISRLRTAPNVSS